MTEKEFYEKYSINSVIFPQYTSLHDLNPAEIRFEDRLRLFHDECIKYSNLNIADKSINLLYLPRSEKENFKPNDRKIPYQDEIKKFVLSKIKNSRIYDTDSVINFSEQINILNHSYNILSNYGSAFYVNGFFSNNSRLIIIDCRWPHHIQWPSMALLYNFIKGRNRIALIRPNVRLPFFLAYLWGITMLRFRRAQNPSHRK